MNKLLLIIVLSLLSLTALAESFCGRMVEVRTSTENFSSVILKNYKNKINPNTKYDDRLLKLTNLEDALDLLSATLKENGIKLFEYTKWSSQKKNIFKENIWVCLTYEKNIVTRYDSQYDDLPVSYSRKPENVTYMTVKLKGNQIFNDTVQKEREIRNLKQRKAYLEKTIEEATTELEQIEARLEELQ